MAATQRQARLVVPVARVAREPPKTRAAREAAHLTYGAVVPVVAQADRRRRARLEAPATTSLAARVEPAARCRVEPAVPADQAEPQLAARAVQARSIRLVLAAQRRGLVVAEAVDTASQAAQVLAVLEGCTAAVAEVAAQIRLAIATTARRVRKASLSSSTHRENAMTDEQRIAALEAEVKALRAAINELRIQIASGHPRPWGP